MDYLQEKHAVGNFVLIGLCSGALQAHRVAVADERVCGAALLDGYGYRTPGYYLRRYGSRLSSPARWHRVFERALRRTRRPAIPADEHPRDHQQAPSPPPRVQVLGELRGLTARGVRLFYVYTRGVEHYYNHAGQFRKMFAALGDVDEIRVSYLPDTDHVFTPIAARAELITALCEWMQSTFASPLIEP